LKLAISAVVPARGMNEQYEPDHYSSRTRASGPGSGTSSGWRM
jgi:hypothetical protein